MTKIGVACSHDALLKSVNVTCHVVGECKQRQSPLGDRSVDTDTFARVHSNARTVHPLGS